MTEEGTTEFQEVKSSPVNIVDGYLSGKIAHETEICERIRKNEGNLEKIFKSLVEPEKRITHEQHIQELKQIGERISKGDKKAVSIVRGMVEGDLSDVEESIKENQDKIRPPGEVKGDEDDFYIKGKEIIMEIAEKGNEIDGLPQWAQGLIRDAGQAIEDGMGFTYRGKIMNNLNQLALEQESLKKVLGAVDKI